MSNGFTGSGKYEPAGIVHEGEALLNCSCGGHAWVTNSGDLVQHSEPIDLEAEHVIQHWRSREIWRYELVG